MEGTAHTPGYMSAQPFSDARSVLARFTLAHYLQEVIGEDV